MPSGSYVGLGRGVFFVEPVVAGAVTALESAEAELGTFAEGGGASTVVALVVSCVALGRGTIVGAAEIAALAVGVGRMSSCDAKSTRMPAMAMSKAHTAPTPISRGMKRRLRSGAGRSPSAGDEVIGVARESTRGGCDAAWATLDSATTGGGGVTRS